MGKIGIVTYPRIEDGKGRFLQAYCLYNAIQELGYDAEILNYYPEEWIKHRTVKDKIKTFVENPNIWAYLKVIKRRMLYRHNTQNTKSKENKYRNFIVNNGIKYNFDKILHKSELDDIQCDAWVCGSDQIWNANFAVGRDDAYYLQFTNAEKRIAYAASMGTLQLDPKYIKRQLKWIREIPYLSVREKDVCKLLSNHNIDAEHVCDPTFLMTRKWWNELAGERIITDNYLLLFVFDNNPLPRKVAEKIAAEKNLKIICLSSYHEDAKKYIILEGLGPKEFTSLFKYAQYVCTQSFHGTVLSLLYNRQFQVFDRSEKGELEGLILRIESLINDFGLQSRIRTKEKDFQDVTIDFSQVNNIIERKRLEGLSFLSCSIRKAIEAG